MTDKRPVRAYARTNPKYWTNLTAEDIPPGWIDDMVKRLFDELNRQMQRFENTGSTDPVDTNAGNAPAGRQVKTQKRDENKSTAESREQDARTLARLQASLERLTKMEMDRASLRATTDTRTRGETRAEIQSDVLAHFEPGGTAGQGGEAQ
jgi:hypothetical protein